MYHFDPAVSSAVTGAEPEPVLDGPLSAEQLSRIDRYWQAANYLTLAQIYLLDNPLLREPLTAAQIKPRLLGHWGTSPGLSLVYVHLNRLIREQGASVIYLAGPGHGGPALVANVYLEGTYSEVYPQVGRDLDGLHRLVRQFSTPGGIPSHVSAPTPGSIHEGGELGYVLTHAFGAAFDNPELIVAAVVGDGEAETGPLAGSWKSVDFLNPARDGAVLPILHLNGYKISGPTTLGRAPDAEVAALLEGNGYAAAFVEGDEPARMHQRFAAALDAAYARIRAIQRDARANGVGGRPRWPAIVLRSPKGWTGPAELNGKPLTGTFRAHQVPLPDVKQDPEQLAMLERWLRSYHPELLFDAAGRLEPDLQALAPTGDLRMGSNPHANGGRLLRDLDLPPLEPYAIAVPRPAAERHESTRQLGRYLRDLYSRSRDTANFRLFCPDETASNRLDDVFEVEDRCFVECRLSIDDHISPAGRVMEVLSEHLCQGWLEGYLLTGRHGIFATYEAFAMVSASMTVQHAKWLEAMEGLAWRAPVSPLTILLTSTCWRQDHNGFSHQGPGLIDVMLSKRGTVARIYLPPDANSLLAIAEYCLRDRNRVNLIVIDKQPELQWLDLESARTHCTRGASIWPWAGNDDGREPDVVLASAGDVPTQELIAAAWWLRHSVPELRIRVVNVIDLMALFPADVHPHGLSEQEFETLFTADRPVVFAFHGYQRAIHEVIHGRASDERFHVRGYREQGTTTTPFDMVVLNGMSRFHLAAEAVRRSTLPDPRKRELIGRCEDAITRAVAYSREHFEDLPEIRDWAWTEP